MSTALKIIEGMQFQPSPADMASALRGVGALANPFEREAAYAAAGLRFDNLTRAKYVALDQQATHIEIERRSGVAA